MAGYGLEAVSELGEPTRFAVHIPTRSLMFMTRDDCGYVVAAEGDMQAKEGTTFKDEPKNFERITEGVSIQIDL